jgi:hypothetical protein
MGDGSIELGGLDHDGFAVPGDLLGGGILSGAVVKVGAAGATLDSTNVIGGNPVYVQNNGTVQVPAGLSLTVVGTLENAGEYDLTTNSFKTSTIDLQGANSSMILAGGTVTLQGYGGQVLMDNASTRIDGPAGQMLVNDSNTITGAGDIGFGDIGFNNGATDSVVDATGRIQIDTGAQAVGNAGTMEASTKAVLDVVSAVDNSGLISASVGALVIVGGAVTDTGTLGITGGAMTLDGGVASGQTVHFSGFLNETLALGSPLSMAGTIENFAFDETIDLVGIAATTLDFASGILHVRDGATEVAALAISGSHQSSDFKLTGDGGTGTDVVSEFAITNTPCFAAGTRLLGANGEIAVEALRPGDRLVTMDGAGIPGRPAWRRCASARTRLPPACRIATCCSRRITRCIWMAC